MPGSALVVIAWVLLAVCLVAFGWRAVWMARLPVHLRWELAPVPHEKDRGKYGGSYLEVFEWWTKPREKDLISEFTYMFLEIVFLRGVWEHNRRLWWFSFPFHFGMYLLGAAGAALVVSGILSAIGLPGTLATGFHNGSTMLAGTGFTLGGIGALGLVVSRLADRRLRSFTTPATLFALALLLAVFTTGGYAVATSGTFTAQVWGFATAVVTADLSVTLPGILTAHLLLALLFLAYLPFSPMMHFVAKYFTYHQVRWDDRPLTPDGRLEHEAVRLMSQPVTWAGPHVPADGSKNWVDLATEETTT
jgi:nitrate reductase gamma subunit